MNQLCEQLNGSQSAEGVKLVLADPQHAPPVVLFLAANAAFKRQQVEDAAFLFYAAQMRTRFDRACFPPVDTGGDDPYVALGALSQEVGSAVNPAVMARPKAFAAALARLKKWRPEVDAPAYDPGYEVRERNDPKAALQATAAHRADFMLHMGDLSKLLLMPDYAAAFRIVQKHNFGAASSPASEDPAVAEATMKRLEKETGLHGVFSE